jgi:glycosyltransferase involved in cell wall biosynthesis
MRVSIIIPVYNEKYTIEELLSRVSNIVLPSTVSHEIIVIDDGSIDGTKKILERFLHNKKKAQWKLISHITNKGKGAAIQSALNHAKGDYILVQDADLEYDPLYIPLLIEPLLTKKAQVVYGTRLKRLPDFKKDEKNPLFLMHYLGNRFLSLLISILYKTWITDMETGYKIIPLSVIKELSLNATGFDIETEITVKLLKKGYTIMEVPIKTKPRNYKQGKKLKAIPEGIKAIKILIKHRFI